MEPVGPPWYASYNRLASGTNTPFQGVPSTTSSDFHPHPFVTSVSQAAVQAATAAGLTAQPPAFNPGSFLTPPPVGYESVFSPLFHHPGAKQAYHSSVSQPRPAVVQNQAASKNNEPGEAPANQAGTFFEGSAAASSSSVAPTIPWSQQNNAAQLPSPFGILPHESVSSPPSGPTTTTKPSNSYEGASFNSQYVNQSIPQLPPSAVAASEFAASDKKRSQSPATKASSSNASLYPQQSSNFNSPSALSNSNYMNGNPSVGLKAPLQHPSSSCIVSSPSNAASSNKDSYRIPTPVAAANAQEKQSSRSSVFTSSKQQQPPVQTKAQSKSYPELNSHMSDATRRNEQTSENSQSSPVSFAAMEQGLNYSMNTGNPRVPPSTNGSLQQQFHLMNQQQQTAQYRQFSGSNSDSEYHYPGRSKSATSTDSAYSSNTSTQNGPDCGGGGVVVPRRPSPLQAHSQASPLGHVPSPAYPMYNSPMSSMPSPAPLQLSENASACSNGAPYKGIQQQLTPPTPLDATVSRSAYPSVITRALGTSGERGNFPGDARAYDRQNSCWEGPDARQANRKFYGNEAACSQSASQQRPSDRAYYEGGQVGLQDLSNCRESASKNLQNPCQVPQIGGMVEHEKKNRKRKSLEPMKNVVTPLEEMSAIADYPNKVPPPAHHNINQPQQNGYYESDRWNLASTTSKMFPNNAAQFAAQASLHYNNYVGNHQPIVVPHHHPPSSLGYFPFHLPPGHHPHHPHDAYQQDATSGSNGYSRDQPKVIVPNIEEELGFLQNEPIYSPNQDKNRRDLNSGFMTSYMKFLQGDKDPTPTFRLGGHKKSSWDRARSYASQQNPSTSFNLNGIMKPPSDKLLPPSSNSAPSIDYANDPRYFPLPKERNKGNFDSSESEDDSFPFGTKKPKKTPNVLSNVPLQSNVPAEKVKKKGRPIKPGGPTDRKRKAAAALAAAAAEAAAKGLPIPEPPVKPKKKDLVDPATLPKRETTKRKAKEKTTEMIHRQQGGDLYDNEEELGDSDSDPAWTPIAKVPGEEGDKVKKRGRPPVIGKNLLKKAENLLPDGTPVLKKRGRKSKHDLQRSAENAVKGTCTINEKLLAAVADEDIDISPFKPGEFIVIKSDLGQEFPPLWRIDGKTVLQKYEPFKLENKTLYRNISTYSGWTPQNRQLYQQVPVRFIQQDNLEIIVEFLRDQILYDCSEIIIKSMKETEKYQDNFEVYIQTLISQALDSNFLTEIFQEKDEYFLTNVTAIDNVTEEKKQSLLSMAKWQSNFITASSTWPCLNILKDSPQAEIKDKKCSGCQQNAAYARVLLYGPPYNSTTLEGSPPDPNISHEKDFLLCQECQKWIVLFNKVAHQKYLMFMECAKRVTDKRATDPNKDTTIILNELLADENWLNQLFKEVRTHWADIDNVVSQTKGAE